MTDEEIAFISGVNQNSMISIDEKGCEVASYTAILYCGAAPPEGKAEMILNRPFIFTITAPEDVVLFAGVINNPVLD